MTTTTAAFHSRLASTTALPVVPHITPDDAIILENDAAKPRFDRANATTLLVGEDFDPPYDVDDSEANRHERESGLADTLAFSSNPFLATPDQDSSSDEEQAAADLAAQAGPASTDWWQGAMSATAWRPLWEQDEFAAHVSTADLSSRGIKSMDMRLKHYTSLTTLVLNDNGIERLGPFSTTGHVLPALQTLDIYNNQLTSLLADGDEDDDGLGLRTTRASSYGQPVKIIRKLTYPALLRLGLGETRSDGGSRDHHS